MWILGFADSKVAPGPDPEPEKDKKAQATPEDPQEEPQLEEEDDSVSDEIHKTLMLLLPWAISILFHLAIILLAIFIVWTLDQPVEEEEPVIGNPSPSPLPPMPIEPQPMEQLQPTQPTRQTQQTVTRPDQVTTPMTVAVPANALSALSPPSAGAPMPGDGPEGEFFGVPAGGAGELPSRVVFVIDASGSLVDTFPFIIDELKRYVRDMKAHQQFTILFFQGDQVLEVPPPGLKQASQEIKARVIDWIDTSSGNVVPGMQGNPVAALDRALRYRAQVIFLLSDNITGQGVYSIGQTALLNAIRRANVAGTKVSTIQFVYEDPMAFAPGPEGVLLGERGRTLYRIAEMTEGFHKFVSAQELNIR